MFMNPLLYKILKVYGYCLKKLHINRYKFGPLLDAFIIYYIYNRFNENILKYFGLDGKILGEKEKLCCSIIIFIIYAFEKQKEETKKEEASGVIEFIREIAKYKVVNDEYEMIDIVIDSSDIEKVISIMKISSDLIYNVPFKSESWLSSTVSDKFNLTTTNKIRESIKYKKNFINDDIYILKLLNGKLYTYKYYYSKGSRILIMVDVSGSMSERNKEIFMKSVTISLAKILKKSGTKFKIYLFNEFAYEINVEKVSSIINVKPDGFTNITNALKTAKSGDVVFLITDGIDDSFKKPSGITLITFLINPDKLTVNKRIYLESTKVIEIDTDKSSGEMIIKEVCNYNKFL